MRENKGFRLIKFELEKAYREDKITREFYIQSLLDLRRELKLKRLSIEQAKYVVERFQFPDNNLSLSDIIFTIPTILN